MALLETLIFRVSRANQVYIMHEILYSVTECDH